MPDDKEEKEDELNLDFGGFKKIFGSGKKKVPEERKEEKGKESKEEHKEKKLSEEKEPEGEEKEEEIKLDFKGIGLFKKKDKEEKEKKAEETQEELSIDFRAISKFFSKYWVVFLILVPVILSIHLRMQAADAPFTDEWAKSSVFNFYKSQIRSQINQQYPNLPDANKNALVEEEFRKMYLQQKDTINQQTAQVSQQFKDSFRDDKGRFYMPDIDPYYWYRYTKNIVEKGTPGDELREGMPYDNYQLAPNGRPIAKQDMFHPYFLSYFYKVMKIFNGSPDFGVMQSLFYYPVFVSALVVILVFLIARRIAGNMAGFFAATMVAISSAFANRTLFGHADSDAWVVFFPVLITWLFVEAFAAKKMGYKLLFASLAGFFTGAFTLAWGGWWYIFDFILAAAGISILIMIAMNYRDIANLKIIRKPEIKSVLIVFAAFLLFSGIFVSVFAGPRTFFLTPVSSIGFTQIKTPVLGSLWPNVLRTVAELNPGSVESAIGSIGGGLLFFIAMLGILLTIKRERMNTVDFLFLAGSAIFWGILILMVRYISPIAFLILLGMPILLRIALLILMKEKEIKETDIFYSLLLTIWFVGTIYATTKGVRFTLLLVPAFSIAFGVGVVHRYLSEWGSKGLHINKLIISILVVGIFFTLFFVPRNLFAEAYVVAQHDVPIVNDAWYNSLTAIKNNSSNNAIITSWWDFGHHFKALADRPVTFDGTTQDTPQAHWVGKILLISDEKQAISILRMLDCGGNNAFNELFKINNDTHKSVDLLNDIVVMEKPEAKSRLVSSGLTEAQAESVLKYTHCNPPEAFFIASEDMIGKTGVWAHFGGWDFEKAAIWRNLREFPKEEAVAYMVENFDYTRQKAENIYFDAQAITDDTQADNWVSPWPGYGGVNGCSKENDILKCSGGLDVNLTSHDAYVLAPQGKMYPRAFAFPTENDFIIKKYDDSLLPNDIGVTLLQEGNSYNILISSSSLTGSMFTRMFYLQGYGLKYFKPFRHETSMTGTDIYVYKVDWEGKSPMPSKPKPEEPESIKNETQNVNENKTTNASTEQNPKENQSSSTAG